ncbi:MAG: ABC transporter permease [Gammaproteobacteria bacterium]|nr:ABC transporter permease [Gammaproteobacteria bacterium]
MTAALLELRYWRYAAYRAYLNLVSDAARYHLGWLWWILEPLAMTGVFYVVFKFLRARDEDFIYFLIVGVTTWLWFSNSVSNATQSLNAAKGLISQIRIPKLMFPLISIMAGTYKQAFVFAILLFVVAALVGVDPTWMWFPLLVLVEILMITATATTAALVCAWLPDSRFVVSSGLQLLMFCSGIFFDINSFAPEAQSWFWLNPIATLLDQYRAVLLHGNAPDLTWCALVASSCLLWVAVLSHVYRRYDHSLTRRIIA